MPGKGSARQTGLWEEGLEIWVRIYGKRPGRGVGDDRNTALWLKKSEKAQRGRSAGHPKRPSLSSCAGRRPLGGRVVGRAGKAHAPCLLSGAEPGAQV